MRPVVFRRNVRLDGFMETGYATPVKGGPYVMRDMVAYVEAEESME
jgi:hypothetical protein